MSILLGSKLITALFITVEILIKQTYKFNCNALVYRSLTALTENVNKSKF